MSSPATNVRIMVTCGNIVGESPIWSEADEALYWVDIVSKTLHAFWPSTHAHHVWHTPELACGIVPRAQGGFVVALTQSLHSFQPVAAPPAKSTPAPLVPLLAFGQDKVKNRNNDMKCDPLGNLWIGTMQNNVADDGSNMAITEYSGVLYRITSALHVEKKLSGIGISNTVAWNPEQDCFYFADSLRDTMWCFDADLARGAITQQRDFFKGSYAGVNQPLGVPDGSATDREGFVWNARFGAHCVLRLTPDGTLDRIIDLPVTNPTSCCFGGPEHRTLFITSAREGLSAEQIAQNPLEGAVLALDVDVPGLPTSSFQG